MKKDQCGYQEPIAPITQKTFRTPGISGMVVFFPTCSDMRTLQIVLLRLCWRPDRSDWLWVLAGCVGTRALFQGPAHQSTGFANSVIREGGNEINRGQSRSSSTTATSSGSIVVSLADRAARLPLVALDQRIP